MKNKPFFILIGIVLLSSCNFPGVMSPEQAASATAASWTFTPSSTATAIATSTFTPSPTSTLTPTPTITETPSITPTPTFAFPTVTVNAQAHCRYGPSTAYLHAADLYAGDTGSVRGRFQNSQWLHVKFDKLEYFCWVAPSVVDVVGDVKTLNYAPVNLPGPSVLYKPPQNVRATRKDVFVTITWDMVNMTEDDDRGYFLELYVCQGGHYIWFTAALATKAETSYTIKDEPGCALPSSGQVYAVEKHAYTKPVIIDWP
ncbi:MAG: hypothetical protein HY867_16490 [Chloroflexi bacterium]|nr:hypothetical protein [Chloroflexota bacterium]